ncbi:hypothetical protein CPC16_011597 [Podila verticillata]|uniref:Uncharacterized protein n=1 Tax=Podila verticillata NRRL 6337 TaxID=1069443 RepID=A0A086TKU1_9FUNG|nr:hypothetical protein BGZ59_009776 [Podila verticillata]KAF9377886.1 hypothetical protein CPC16_011597 [Podila verticillata]KAI9241530.1 MAG: ribonuclease H-like domain-containing protein [Podila humilis]KFH62568.1 hypothetical protein MVEG_11961 [Podila verticillata NRRL 6337]
MEIIKDNFEASLPMLKKAIEECDFVAMDTEMTGLALPINVPKNTDSLSTRYQKVSTSAGSFLVIQLGICTFTWRDEIGGYEARPFNFPCFPSSADEAKAGERFFKCQSTSLEFLIKNGFDFNKWILHGIPYLTRPEEEAYIIRKTEKEANNASASVNNIAIDDRNKTFVTMTIERIQEWLQNSTEETLVLQANNSFFRRLVYQVIRTDFNDALHAVADTRARTMTVQRMTDEIRLQKEQAKIPKPPMLNLRRVLDMTIEAKKPLIGHNCFLDLMQITQQFLWDVPRELEDWKRSLNLEWNTIIDTKHLAGHPMIKEHLESTGLEIVSECVQKEPFSTVGPKIVMAEGFDRYLADASLKPAETNETDDKTQKDDTKYHEAGYDAYITGQAFLRFAGFILKEHERAAANQEAHTRKKRRVETEGEEGVESSETPECTSETGESLTATKGEQGQEEPKKGQEKEEDEEEDGELSETELEKEMLMERSKRVIIGNPTKSILETEELQNYYNFLHMMRSDIPVMNLTGPDQEPAERPWNLLLKNIPAGSTTSTLFYLFGPYNPFRFTWVDDRSAWIQLSRFPPGTNGPPANGEPAVPYEPKSLPIGLLGEDYVKPFCVGTEEEAMKGREVGVVFEAAQIEVVSWKTWYDQKEAEDALKRQMRQDPVSSAPYQKRPLPGSRAEGQRSLEPVLPEQNDAVPASLPVAVAGAADPAEALPGSETSAISAGSKRKLEDE